MKEVRIEWIDSCGGDCYWTPLSDYTPSIQRPISYGFVVYEDDEKISIAQSFAEQDGDAPQQINGVITIPKCSIINIKILN